MTPEQERAEARKAISAKYMTMEDAEKIVPWLRNSLDREEQLIAENERITGLMEQYRHEAKLERELRESFTDKLKIADKHLEMISLGYCRDCVEVAKEALSLIREGK